MKLYSEIKPLLKDEDFGYVISKELGKSPELTQETVEDHKNALAIKAISSRGKETNKAY